MRYYTIISEKGVMFRGERAHITQTAVIKETRAIKKQKRCNIDAGNAAFYTTAA